MEGFVSGKDLKVGDVIFTECYGRFLKVEHVENGHRYGIVSFRLEGMKPKESFACTIYDRFPLQVA